ncbi:MAG TPA: DUF4390 domain-containing protein [Burkholderiaceae bacterium]|nr:DUF4390 domain-containing protein [Burkholderiaceae bacterium]
MLRLASVHRRRQGPWQTVAGLLALCWLLLAGVPARADVVELSNLAVARAEEGVLLSFNTRFELSHTVEEALHKGVPLHFVAEATLYRSRWYWRDQRVARATRSWRLTYQPLTRSYRVGIGGLSQSFDNLAEAMSVLRASSRWKIAEAAQVEDDSRHYVEFSYRLDTTQLPRPMQIGFGAQPEWTLAVERNIRVD